ncbi:MAG: hypothetical protein ABIR18_02875 [Chitinophagaceae bacterium]
MKRCLLIFLSSLIVHEAIAQAATITVIKKSSPVVYLADGSVTSSVNIERKWTGDFGVATITNKSNAIIKHQV